MNNLDILFRGMLKDDNSEFKRGQWVFGDLVRLQVGTCSKPHIYGYGEVLPDSVGQFTGYFDNFNQKIFVGDIVQFDSVGYIPTTRVGFVCFQNSSFGICYDYYGPWFHILGSVDEWRDMGASGKITYSYKVIGNIIENSDLLKK